MEKKQNALISKKKEELDRAQFELERAENNYDLETSAKLRHGVIPALQKELDTLQKEKNIVQFCKRRHFLCEKNNL